MTYESLKNLVKQNEGNIHMHLAEQTGEVDEILEFYGSRPVDWLLENFEVDDKTFH